MLIKKRPLSTDFYITVWNNLIDNIVQFIKIISISLPIIITNTILLDSLLNYAITTDKYKILPEEPLFWDLGLLRDKVHYESVMIKAENV